MTSDTPQPTLRLNIDKDALAANWRSLDRMSGAARAGAAVKAQCYGLGVEACVPTLRDAGANQFFVAHWSEVAAVAAHVPADCISVLHGPMNSQDAAYARSTGAVPVINSLHQAQVWQDSGGGLCDVMVDTGINRLGIAPQHVCEDVVQALNVRNLMSHLACADEDSPKNALQLEAFREVAGKLNHQSLSLANSAGIALGPDYAFGLTRPGLSLYGGSPPAGTVRSHTAGGISAGCDYPDAHNRSGRKRGLQCRLYRRTGNADRRCLAGLCRRLSAQLERCRRVKAWGIPAAASGQKFRWI